MGTVTSCFFETTPRSPNTQFSWLPVPNPNSGTAKPSMPDAISPLTDGPLFARLASPLPLCLKRQLVVKTCGTRHAPKGTPRINNEPSWTILQKQDVNDWIGKQNPAKQIFKPHNPQGRKFLGGHE